jgi:hypothetical protein
LERDVERDVALLLGDLHQDWCPHEPSIVDRGAVFDRKRVDAIVLAELPEPRAHGRLNDFL